MFLYFTFFNEELILSCMQHYIFVTSLCV